MAAAPAGLGEPGTAPAAVDVAAAPLPPAAASAAAAISLLVRLPLKNSNPYTGQSLHALMNIFWACNTQHHDPS